MTYKCFFISYRARGSSHNSDKASSGEASDRGELDINWPRPGSLVRSPTVAVSINIAFPNGTLARPEGTSCVTMRSLDDEGDFVESCVEVAAETEHLEFRVPWVTKTRIGLALSIDGRTSLPLDLTVDPAMRRPPLTWNDARLVADL